MIREGLRASALQPLPSPRLLCFNVRRLLLLSAVGLGIVISGYLLYRYFALAAPGASSGFDVCSIFFAVGDCDDALRSDWAIWLGLPLAGWGIVYYGTIATLLLLGWSLKEAFRQEAIVASQLLAASAAVAGLGLLVVMSTGLSPFCPLCAVIHALNLLLAVFIGPLEGVSMRQARVALRGAASYLLGGSVEDATAARWKVVGFLAVGLVALVLFQWTYLDVAIRKARAAASVDLDAVAASLSGEPARRIPVDAEDPQIGPEDAPVSLVVFSDFQCPACRSFARELGVLLQRFPQELRVVFKDFPLDAECNKVVRRTRHPSACEAAAAAEAARLQGKFWEFYRLAFSADKDFDGEKLRNLAQEAGLEMERFDDCRSQPGVAAAVERDIALALRLRVDSTPAVFLNGRRLRDIRPKALEAAIAYLAGQPIVSDT